MPNRKSLTQTWQPIVHCSCDKPFHNYYPCLVRGRELYFMFFFSWVAYTVWSSGMNVMLSAVSSSNYSLSGLFFPEGLCCWAPGWNSERKSLRFCSFPSLLSWETKRFYVRRGANIPLLSAVIVFRSYVVYCVIFAFFWEEFMWTVF